MSDSDESSSSEAAETAKKETTPKVVEPQLDQAGKAGRQARPGDMPASDSDDEGDKKVRVCVSVRLCVLLH